MRRTYAQDLADLYVDPDEEEASKSGTTADSGRAAGASIGGAAGTGVGAALSLLGLIGGPASPITVPALASLTVPAGAAIGSALGGAVGGGVGSAEETKNEETLLDGQKRRKTAINDIEIRKKALERLINLR